MRVYACLAGSLLALLSCIPASRAADGPPAGFRQDLFNGRDLSGWQVTGCEATVADGALHLKAGDGFVRTLHTYRDFILEVEWKALADDNWDSGIYIRSALPPAGKPWPAKHQINLRRGQEGNLLGLPGGTSKGLVKEKEWNSFRVTVLGTKVQMQINGQNAWSVEGLPADEGFIGLQCEAPLGGQFLFRNLRITELGYRSVFNGQDLAGWEGGGSPAASCWSVDSGTLYCNGKKGPWLKSTWEAGDFNFKFEYQVAPGGNSGVYCRVPADGNHHGAGSGVEIQVLDDRDAKYASLKPYQYCGGVYDFAGPTEKLGLPAGQWNAMEIDCRGSRYRVKHNGVLVVDVSGEKVPELAQRRAAGFLGLQNHTSEVRFRHLRIQPLGP